MSLIRGKWKPEEYQVRLGVVRDIVFAAYSIQGKYLDEENLNRQSRIWEESFDGVATEHLPDLYTVGISKKCRTAAEFENVWYASVIAKHDEMENRAFLNRLAEQEQHPAITPAVARQKAAEWRARAKSYRKAA